MSTSSNDVLVLRVSKDRAGHQVASPLSLMPGSGVVVSTPKQGRTPFSSGALAGAGLELDLGKTHGGARRVEEIAAGACARTRR